MMQNFLDGLRWRPAFADGIRERDEIVSRRGRQIKVFVGPAEALPLAGYFRLVAAGVYKTTDTAAKLLEREPWPYAHWLGEHRPFAT